MQYIKENMDVIDKNRDIALMLFGDPGISKSAQIEEWCEEHGRRMIKKIASQSTPSEIAGMAMPVNETKTMEVFDWTDIMSLKDGDVLFFDELTNGFAQTLNACLTLIQDRVLISGKKLPDILVVAAGNPQGSCELLPQLKERFMWINVGFCKSMWRDYVKDTLGITPSTWILNEIELTYSHGFDQMKYNYLTARRAYNYYKIAKTIPENHSFWTTLYNADSRLCSYIYRDIKVSQKKPTKYSLLEKARENGIPTDGLNEFYTEAELNEWISNLNTDQLATLQTIRVAD